MKGKQLFCLGGEEGAFKIKKFFSSEKVKTCIWVMLVILPGLLFLLFVDITTYRNLSKEENTVIEELIGADFPENMRFKKCMFEIGSDTYLHLVSDMYDMQEFTKQMTSLLMGDGEYGAKINKNSLKVNSPKAVINCYFYTDGENDDEREYVEITVKLKDEYSDEAKAAVKAIKELRKKG